MGFLKQNVDQTNNNQNTYNQCMHASNCPYNQHIAPTYRNSYNENFAQDYFGYSFPNEQENFLQFANQHENNQGYYGQLENEHYPYQDYSNSYMIDDSLKVQLENSYQPINQFNENSYIAPSDQITASPANINYNYMGANYLQTKNLAPALPQNKTMPIQYDTQPVKEVFNPYKNPLVASNSVQKNPFQKFQKNMPKPINTANVVQKPSGVGNILNQFKSQNGSLDVNKMVGTAGQMVSALGQVSGLLKGIGGIFKK